MLELNLKGRLNNLSDFRFEMFENKDLDEIIEFQREAYSDQFNASDYADEATVRNHFIWKYLDIQNTVNRPFIWLAKLQRKIIAQFCIMPHDVKIEDEFYKTGWGQDFIVSPNFRNIGLGYFLIKHALEELNGHIDLLFVGGTNKASYPLFRALGFIDIGVLPRYIKILGFPKATSKDISSNQGFNLDFDKVWHKLGDVGNVDIKCIFKRDKQDIRQRFINQQRPFYKIFMASEDIQQINGYIILREGKIRDNLFKDLKVGIISDLFYPLYDKKSFNSLFDEAVRYFKSRGMNLIRLDILAPRSNLALLRRGFIRIPSNNRFLFFPIKKDLKSKEGLIRCKRNWFLTFFDSDFDLP